MESYLPIIVFFVCLLICLGVAHHFLEGKRRKAFQDLAARYGLTYRAGKDFDIPRHYEFLNHLGEGEKRYAYNILEGVWKGIPLLAFDYNRTVVQSDLGKQSQYQEQGSNVFIVGLSRQFPELLIYPENILTKFSRLLGFKDIDFDSIEFSRAFVVKSSDKKFAYDVCHPRMMEYLLGHRDLSLEIERDSLSFAFTPRLSTADIERRLAQLVEIRKLLPEYLFRD